MFKPTKCLNKVKYTYYDGGSKRSGIKFYKD